MNQPASQLARYVAKPATSDAALKAMGARAWEDQQTLVIRLSSVSDPVIRQMVCAVAGHVFGGRVDG
ncbi:hypothetical protein LCGC14_3107410 [marine sediment metagenome]|uniref:Uncharacterized protein n=1 Tax=marine sediment metagenome TaxID=412755 RepID=A0A0F8YDI3_9ZZZZ